MVNMITAAGSGLLKSLSKAVRAYFRDPYYQVELWKAGADEARKYIRQAYEESGSTAFLIFSDTVDLQDSL